MRVGLIDVDNYGKKTIRFPNLALMKLSAYHKKQGDDVEWWWSDFIHYDIVYKSKVFSDAYTKDIPDPINADVVVHGGSGYCIRTANGVEEFDKTQNTELPYHIEHIMPDYSLYGIKDHAYGFMSRGCPRGCTFCHVNDKEGLKTIKVSDLSEFWNGQKYIDICDPNTLACKEWRDILSQLADSRAYVDMNQGIDIRLMTIEKAEILNKIRLKNIHFAWDNAKDNLIPFFEMWASQKGGKASSHGDNGTVYCLTNYNSTMEENLHRVYSLKNLGFKPYIMIYNKPNAPKEIRDLQRWVNNPILFYTIDRFEDYEPRKGELIMG